MLFSIIFSGCYADDSASSTINAQPPLPIEIIDLFTINSYVLEMNINPFTITIKYYNPLSTTADIYIGFNHIDQYSIRYLDAYAQTVEPGFDSLTVDVEVLIDSWDYSNDFKVHVMLFDIDNFLPIGEDSYTIFYGN